MICKLDCLKEKEYSIDQVKDFLERFENVEINRNMDNHIDTAFKRYNANILRLNGRRNISGEPKFPILTKRDLYNCLQNCPHNAKVQLANSFHNWSRSLNNVYQIQKKQEEELNNIAFDGSDEENANYQRGLNNLQQLVKINIGINKEMVNIYKNFPKK